MRSVCHVLYIENGTFLYTTSLHFMCTRLISHHITQSISFLTHTNISLLFIFTSLAEQEVHGPQALGSRPFRVNCQSVRT
jgi:hypothetical protein